jgi:hypothetical protein
VRVRIHDLNLVIITNLELKRMKKRQYLKKMTETYRIVEGHEFMNT